MKKLLPAILVSVAASTSWGYMLPGVSSRGDTASSTSKQPIPSPNDCVPPRRAEDLPGFEKAVRSVYERTLPCVGVMYFGTKRQRLGTGVLISREGYVLTHAHHMHPPGSSVTMIFGDGRKAGGRLLGVHRHFDLSLVKLDGQGPWPAAPLGSAASLKPGDPCLAIGYPFFHPMFYGDSRDEKSLKIYSDPREKGQPPLLRLGRILGLHEHYVMSSCSVFGGDSGGPLFNLQGEVIGTAHLASIVVDVREVKVAGYINVDVFPKIRQQLLQEKVFTEDTLWKAFERTGPFENTKGLDSLAATVHRSVVTVFAKEKPVALGLVIDADGWVVTKASVLAGPLTCQLADGRKLEASLKAKSEKHDLALLQVPAKDLPAAPWSDSPAPSVAQVVASIGPKSTPLCLGVVCAKVEAVPVVLWTPVNGLSEVFVHDGLLNSQQCGGPVVDAKGKVIGLNIATKIFDETSSYAIPAAVVRKIVTELRKKEPAR